MPLICPPRSNLNKVIIDNSSVAEKSTLYKVMHHYYCSNSDFWSQGHAESLLKVTGKNIKENRVNMRCLQPSFDSQIFSSGHFVLEALNALQALGSMTT